MIWSFLDVAIYAVGLAALTWGGNPPCRLLLNMSGIALPQPEAESRAGRMIGSLERTVILLGLAAGSWEIIAAVIALKTVGRFKELDERIQAEYFLIGSLASVVWAALVSLGLMWFDRSYGFGIAALARAAGS